jgi:hypothetical protein
MPLSTTATVEAEVLFRFHLDQLPALLMLLILLLLSAAAAAAAAGVSPGGGGGGGGGGGAVDSKLLCQFHAIVFQ